MGRLKLQAGINAIEEEPEEYDDAYPNKTTLACMINSEIGAVMAVMRRNVRWGGRYMSGDDQLEHSLILSLKNLKRRIVLGEFQKPLRQFDTIRNRRILFVVYKLTLKEFN